ncbi:cytochrome P450 [Trametes gibbosa]|nr:cytochrome P450 [Trametes gibbosa]
MAPLQYPLVWACVAVISLLLIRAYIKSKKYSCSFPLPPGPKATPILGNALDLPLSKQWLALQAWAEQYGDVLHISLLGQPVIVLSSVGSAADLLDKRSAKYSDRFKSTVAGMIGWDWNVALMGYGPKWRETRRAFHEHFHQGAVRDYQPTQLIGARKFLTRLLANPDNFVPDLRYDLGATILDVSYGIKAKDNHDEYIAIGERAVEGPAKALVLGALWVEFLPFLRHVPPWVPGASYQKKAAQWRKDAMMLTHEPFRKAITDFHDGAGTWSLASEVMHRDYQMGSGSSAGTEELAMNVAAVTYGAGADTSFSTLQTFFLAMALYPEVQRKAQAELDVVIGQDRLPEFADLDSLPYIHAVVKECLRWQNVFPLGIPHRLMEDDEYKGHFIPKGSIVLANIWAIAHNPRTYADPDRFNPDRYFKDGAWDSSVLDPTSYIFGFGRRECPGRHFAVASIYIYVASVLQVFNIKPKRDGDGNVVDIKPDVISGVVTCAIMPHLRVLLPDALKLGPSYRHPAKFECDIKPRSAEAEALIRLCMTN